MLLTLNVVFCMVGIYCTCSYLFFFFVIVGLLEPSLSKYRRSTEVMQSIKCKHFYNSSHDFIISNK